MLEESEQHRSDREERTSEVLCCLSARNEPTDGYGRCVGNSINADAHQDREMSPPFFSSLRFPLKLR